MWSKVWSKVCSPLPHDPSSPRPPAPVYNLRTGKTKWAKKQGSVAHMTSPSSMSSEYPPDITIEYAPPCPPDIPALRGVCTLAFAHSSLGLRHLLSAGFAITYPMISTCFSKLCLLEYLGWGRTCSRFGRVLVRVGPLPTSWIYRLREVGESSGDLNPYRSSVLILSWGDVGLMGWVRDRGLGMKRLGGILWNGRGERKR